MRASATDLSRTKAVIPKLGNRLALGWTRFGG